MNIEDEEIKQLEEDYNSGQQGSAPFFGQEKSAEAAGVEDSYNSAESPVNTFPGQAVSRGSGLNFSPNGQKAMLLIVAVAAIAAAAFFFMPKQDKAVNDLIVTDPSQNIKAETIGQGDDAKAPAEEDEVAIIGDDDIIADDVRTVAISFDNVGRANPFLPGADAVPDVRRYGFDLIAPPESVTSESQASRVMTTKISGIMYDKYNPSAILNIEGEDYFVRSGDNINGYKILAIAKDMVTVQLGSNVYKTRVGEAITEGEVNYNNVYDLKNKFGGARK